MLGHNSGGRNTATNHTITFNTSFMKKVHSVFRPYNDPLTGPQSFKSICEYYGMKQYAMKTMIDHLLKKWKKPPHAKFSEAQVKEILEYVGIPGTLHITYRERR